MLRLCEWGYKATVPDREAGQLQPDSERIRTEKASRIGRKFLRLFFGRFYAECSESAICSIESNRKEDRENGNHIVERKVVNQLVMQIRFSSVAHR